MASAQGRKDRGEDLTVAAVRETFEETGYPCEWLPLDLTTRPPSPEAGAQTKNARSWERGAVHADVATYGGRGVKFIWWFATVCTGEDKVEGTQTAVESFESVDKTLRAVMFRRAGR